MNPQETGFDRLSRGGKCWLAVAVTFAVAGMLAGMWFSFWNLSAAAAAHGWRTPYLLPAVIDLGIPTYVIIDHLIIVLGWKSRLPRVAAWGFAGLTILLNGAVTSDPSPLWRITAAAMPAVWVLGIEVLRLIWRALRKDPASKPDRIPAGRWIASPAPTALLWRRMSLLGVTSWPLMLAMEDARLHCADIVTAARCRRPDLPVPLTVRRATRSGRFPGDVSDAVKRSLAYGGAAVWEPALEAWLASRLGLPETIAEMLSNDRREVPAVAAPEPAAPALPEPAAERPGPARQRPAPGAVKRAQKAGRKAGDELLLEAIRELAESGAVMTRYRVAKELPVGEPKADRLLAAWQAERPSLSVAR